MTQHKNPQGQPIGAPVPEWTGCAPIPRTPMQGRYCDLVPLDAAHSADLFAAFDADTTGTLWTYMPVGPFATAQDYAAWVATAQHSKDPLFFTIIAKDGRRPVGVASFLRMDPANGVAEVGFITFAPALQRTPAATEAMYLMMKRAFDLGYRRYEWKCDALNAPSRKAAARLGFSYDGLFRQATVYKGRNRDTAWFSILDKDWPALDQAFQLWLAAENFGPDGRQRQRFGDLAPQPNNNPND
ncbi:Protein N-acetyltransferase, RimJ/RimL family [Yoonia tamlensis]|uniref:Protein N-acetyltransferase, RimJ/RimL family n=1 Tax=Yoonia tamlensis TaxID=390270 RepID=A0A1I6GWE9_9RHOB|nr:GNAT family protein [Yoonia tamlensis]SFR46409.1 Protein N-acetyltransferase, RimJ/RimL family [Yoonia tamlensis]